MAATSVRRIGYILVNETQPILFTTSGTATAEDIELIFEQHDMAVTAQFIERTYPARMQAFVDVWIEGAMRTIRKGTLPTGQSEGTLSTIEGTDITKMLLQHTWVCPTSKPLTVEDITSAMETIVGQFITMDADPLYAASAPSPPTATVHYVLYMNGRLTCLNTVPMDMWSYIPDVKTRVIQTDVIAEAVRLNMHGRLYPSWDVVETKLAALKAFVGDDATVPTPSASAATASTTTHVAAAASVPIPTRAVPLRTLLGVMDQTEDARKNPGAVKNLTPYNVTAETFLDERQAVKQCVQSLFVISDRSEPEFRMRAQKLAETIEQSIGVPKEESVGFRSRLSDYLLKDIGLRKQRDSRGFYYFGIQAKTAPTISSLEDFVEQRKHELSGKPSTAEYRASNEFNTHYGAVTGQYPAVFGGSD